VTFGKTILSNFPIMIALIIIGSVPIFILQDGFYIANQIATFALYCLIVGIIWRIVHYLLRTHQYKNELHDNRVETYT
jgi:hypothetical protein